MIRDTLPADFAAAEATGPEAPSEHLREAVRCIESLAARHEPSALERLRLLSALDDACQAPSRACATSFVTQAVTVSREGLLRHVPDFWQTLLEAYDLLLSRLASPPGAAESGVIAALAVRALRAGQHCARWAAFAGEPLDGACWQRLNQVYLSARDRQADVLGVRVRADRDTETCVEREYLALLAQHTLALQQLDAASVELALRLCRQALAQLEFGRVRGISSQLWIDPAAGLPPARMLEADMPGKGVLFFSAAAAVPALQRLLDLAIRGRVPPELVPAGGTVQLAAVLSYMIRQWSADAPVRNQARQALSGPVEVVWGFSAVVQGLHTGASLGAFEPDPGCVLRDVSSAGVGIELVDGGKGGHEVGALLSLRLSDDDLPRIGVVRRWMRQEGARLLLGCEFLGREAQLLTVVAGGQALHALAIDPLQSGVPVRLILPSDMANQSVLRLIDHPGMGVLQALTTAEPGGDHVLRSYLPG
ncbi:hypothetical protein ACFONG_00270 [Uliginosibacterium paludis]|uniref:PilZ domain-containing protein n=1 Tax=Uliginosibacterium paludis TaxID=1615952 RepID=A0ABV2CRB4_9RHOO